MTPGGQPERYDLIVIGGGIVGSITAAIAVLLRAEGSVLVIDREDPSRPSSHSLAVDATSFESARRRLLVDAAVTAAALLREAVPAYNGIEQAALWIVRGSDVARVKSTLNPGTLHERDREAVELDRMGISVPNGMELLASDRVCYSEPNLAIEQALAAVERHPRGSVLIDEVASIRHDGSSWEVILVSGRAVATRGVVIATGLSAAGNALVPGARAVEGRGKRVVAFQLECTSHRITQPVFFESDDAFLIPDPRDETRAWLSIRGTEWIDVGAGTDARPRDREIAIADELINTYLPRASVEIVGARIAHELYTPTSDPYLASEDGLAWAVGGSGSGFRLAPGIALEVLSAVGYLNEKDLASVS